MRTQYLKFPELDFLTQQMRTLLLIALGYFAASLHVQWFAPFYSGGGYCSEAISFVQSLSSPQYSSLISLSIAQHGDTVSTKFVAGLPDSTRILLEQLSNTDTLDNDISICHCEPGAIHPPNYRTSYRCPSSFASIAIARTMFETDRLPRGWSEKLNTMDYVWVPSQFNRATFLEGGVDPSKVVVIPEPVDIDFFSPINVDKYDLTFLGLPENSFIFLSVFKWEERKGWKFLLDAFIEEFGSNQGVTLLILTHTFYSSADFNVQIDSYIDQHHPGLRSRPSIHLIPPGVPTSALPGLYASSHAFVLPSRGEGWGRPHVEAMSMELPVIATNWSGPTEFMTKHNSYPIPIDDMDEILDGAFAGHRWARPSVRALSSAMRDVFENYDQAKERGKQARRDMVRYYCPDCVANLVVKELFRISKPKPRIVIDVDLEGEYGLVFN